MNPDHHEWRIIEALLFRSSEPLHERHLKSYILNPSDLSPLLLRMQTFYQYRGVNLVRAGKLWSFITAPDLTEPLQDAENKTVPRRESTALSEILAIIAYHQPITRSEIASVRGIETNSTILSRMLSYGWIRSLGRRDTLGKPMQWGTTDAFLHHFGFQSLDDLPSVDELQKNGLIPPEPDTPIIDDAHSYQNENHRDE